MELSSVMASDEYIKQLCDTNDNIAKAVQALDEYDFSTFFHEGMSLSCIKDNIEHRYDSEFFNKFGFYVFDAFDALSDEISVHYFYSRYSLRLLPYRDWVVYPEVSQESINKINNPTKGEE